MLRSLGAVMALTLSSALTSAQNADPAKMLEACRAIADNAARLRCFENATSQLGAARPAPATPVPTPLPSAPSATGNMEGWRLVRTPHPAGGKDAISIMHTAEVRSDPDLAGLMVRCGETGNEVLIVLITPFPPRANPQVTLSAGAEITRLQAGVLPPGAAILLPPEATALASGQWQTLNELSIEVVGERTTVRGIIALKGLATALQVLTANCPAR